MQTFRPISPTNFVMCILRVYVCVDGWMDVLPVAGERVRALLRARLFRLSAVRAIFLRGF